MKKDDRNYGELLLENIELRQKNLKLEQALQEYANETNWTLDCVDNDYCTGTFIVFMLDSYQDGWEIAQKALMETTAWRK